jgi:hypothetical protein
MASNSFQRLSLVRSTKFDQLDRNDPYWSFQFPTTVKEDNNISHVAFNPHSPYELLVTSGFHMRIFSRQSAKIGKTFTRFRSVPIILKRVQSLLGKSATAETGEMTEISSAPVLKKELCEFSTKALLPALLCVNSRRIMIAAK